jgi:hypothetical protein
MDSQNKDSGGSNGKFHGFFLETKGAAMIDQPSFFWDLALGSLLTLICCTAAVITHPRAESKRLNAGDRRK